LFVLARAAALATGSFIALTSAAGLFLGVQAGDGWLAILYGAMGVSMGIAGAVSLFVNRPLRSALLGWFLVGIAARAVIDAGIYLWFFSFPIVVAFVGAFVLELVLTRSRAGVLAAAGGGALSLASLVLLALAAPILPVICGAPPPPGGSTLRISYPPTSFPWDEAEFQYIVSCP
jgi:hypothetical protein